MPTRTSEGAVKSVLDTQLDVDQIKVFIQDASLWVDEELGEADLSVERLELIERYLACALIRIRDLGLTEVKMGDVAEQYQVDPKVSDYLIKAAAFDSTGKVRQTFIIGPSAGGGSGSISSDAVMVRIGRGYDRRYPSV